MKQLNINNSKRLVMSAIVDGISRSPIGHSALCLCVAIGLGLSACNRSAPDSTSTFQAIPKQTSEAPVPTPAPIVESNALDTILISKALNEFAPKLYKPAPRFLEVNFDHLFLFSEYQDDDSVSALGTGLRVNGSSSQVMNSDCVSGDTVTGYPNRASFRLHIKKVGSQLKVQIVGQVVKIQSVLSEPKLNQNLVGLSDQSTEYSCGNSYASEISQGGRIVSNWAYDLNSEDISALEYVDSQLDYTWEFENDARSIDEMKSLLNAFSQKLRFSGGGFDLIDYRSASSDTFKDILSTQLLNLHFEKIVEYVTNLEEEGAVANPVGGVLSVGFEKLLTSQ